MPIVGMEGAPISVAIVGMEGAPISVAIVSTDYEVDELVKAKREFGRLV